MRNKSESNGGSHPLVCCLVTFHREELVACRFYLETVHVIRDGSGSSAAAATVALMTLAITAAVTVTVIMMVMVAVKMAVTVAVMVAVRVTTMEITSDDGIVIPRGYPALTAAAADNGGNARHFAVVSAG